MMATRWRAFLDHPIVQLELRRIRRWRWRPGRRFFLAYSVLLGGALGCLLTWVLIDREKVRLAVALVSVPAHCVVGPLFGLLSVGLPWIAPVFTAPSIARERELGTLDLLRVTLLGERSIVLGKLAAALARLWPGVLALLLLLPFRIILSVGSVSPGSLFFAPDPLIKPEEEWLWWIGVAMLGVSDLLRPWGDLAFHATVGLFASSLFRSSTLAIAAAYGAIVVARAGIGLVGMLFPVLFLAVPIGMGDSPLVMALIAPSVASLVTALGEGIASVLLVWGTILRLERM